MAWLVITAERSAMGIGTAGVFSTGHSVSGREDVAGNRGTGDEEAMALTVASWNINGVRARLLHVVRYLEERSPDVL
jgi:hypothetical protein